MQLLNLFACAFLFGFSSWAILSPHFHDGILMKKGLIILAMTSFASVVHYFDPMHAVDAQTSLLNMAFAIIAWSMIWRRIHRPVWGWV